MIFAYLVLLVEDKGMSSTFPFSNFKANGGAKRKCVDSYIAFYSKELSGLRNMHTFREIGIVSYGRNTNKIKKSI